MPLLRVATRKSPLALAQTELAIAHLRQALPELTFEQLPMSTTGDERLQWSLSVKGGKGLFTSELEKALAEGRADLAVHSAKDLPTEMEPGLVLAGFLPRAPVHDVLVRRAEVAHPKTIATGSPRRRQQLARRFPEAIWSELRGNVGTRLDKIARGEADASVLAAAGLHRLGITAWPGLVFEPLALDDSVPAAGQGAIALQCRRETAALLGPHLCAATATAVTIERALLAALGGGCHSAVAAHWGDGVLRLYHEAGGRLQMPLPAAEATPERLQAIAQRIVIE